MPHGFRLVAVMFVCAGLGVAPASAQTSEPEVPTQPAPPKLDPKACVDRDRLTQGDTVGTDGRGAPDETRSDTLARTGGVICPPPGLDPHIRAPAPETQSDMPVIEPPAANSDGAPR